MCFSVSDFDDLFLEVKQGESIYRLLSFVDLSIERRCIEEVTYASKRCFSEYYNTTLSYQVARRLLESAIEPLEILALFYIVKIEPISDLKTRLLYLERHSNSPTVTSMIIPIIKKYSTVPAFVKRDDGYLEFLSVFDLVRFLDQVHTPSQWLYRGHNNPDWKLIANAFRPFSSKIREQEEIPLVPVETRDFIYWIMNNERISHLTDGNGYDSIEALAIAQHHGFETPLLDFSYSNRVSAFFASEAHLSDGIGVVHAVSTNEIKSLVGEKPSEKMSWLGDSPFIIDREFRGLRRIHNQQGVFIQSLSPALLNDIAIDRYYFRHTGVKYTDNTINEDFIYPPATELEEEIELYKLLYTGYI